MRWLLLFAVVACAATEEYNAWQTIFDRDDVSLFALAVQTTMGDSPHIPPEGLTVFVPTDDALAEKMNPFTLNALFADDDLLLKFVQLHIVKGTSPTARELAWTTRESFLRPFDAHHGWSAGDYVGKGQEIEGYMVDGKICVGGPGNQVSPTDFFEMNEKKALGNLATITDTIYSDPYCTVHTIDNLLAPEKMQYCERHADCDGAARYCFIKPGLDKDNCDSSSAYGESMSSAIDAEPPLFVKNDGRCLMTCGCRPHRKTNAVTSVGLDGQVSFSCESDKHVLSKTNTLDDGFVSKCIDGEWDEPEPPTCICPTPEPAEIVEGYWWGTGEVGTQARWVCNDGFNYRTGTTNPRRVPYFTCSADPSIGWTIDGTTYEDPAGDGTSSTLKPSCYPAKICPFTELAAGRYWSTNEMYYFSTEIAVQGQLHVYYVDEADSASAVWSWDGIGPDLPVPQGFSQAYLRFTEDNRLSMLSLLDDTVPTLQIGADAVGPDNGVLCMQDDGDLVLYDGAGDPIAHTATAGSTEAVSTPQKCLQVPSLNSYEELSDSWSVCQHFVTAGLTAQEDSDFTPKTQQGCWDLCRSGDNGAANTYAVVLFPNGASDPACYCTQETTAEVAAKTAIYAAAPYNKAALTEADCNTSGNHDNCPGLTNAAECTTESWSNCGGQAGTVDTEPQPARYIKIVAGACPFPAEECPPPAAE